MLRPARVADPVSDRVAVGASDGHLVVFPVSDLPAMERGKGNKLIALPASKRGQPRHAAVAIACVPPGGSLEIYSGKWTLTLKPADVERYAAERGRRGAALPRGFQRADALGVAG